MTRNPLISVIIPMYNAERYIERCIASIIQQTYKNIEIIIIDDGSQDNSKQIVHQLINKYNINIIKYFWQKNKGVSAARNYGLQQANGDYLTFVDADDWIAPEMYNSMLQLIQQNNADLVICGRIRVIEDKEIHYKSTNILHFYDGKIEMNQLGNQFDLNISPNKLYDRKLWDDLKLPENMSYAEDLYIMPDILKKSKHTIYTSNGYYYYYENLSSASFNLNQEKLQSDIIAKKKLYQYMKSKKANTNIAFDFLFGAYTRGYNMGGEKKFRIKIRMQYILFYCRNFLECITKLKCSIFLLSPTIYFKLQNASLNKLRK